MQSSAGRTAAGGLDASKTGRFRSADRLHNRREFQRVYDRGQKLHGPHLTLFVLPNQLDHSRLGVAATRKIGGAVQRNLAKRRMREIFRRHRARPGFDVVVVPKREFFEATFAEIAAEYQSVVARAGRAHARRGSTESQ